MLGCWCYIHCLLVWWHYTFFICRHFMASTLIVSTFNVSVVNLVVTWMICKKTYSYISVLLLTCICSIQCTVYTKEYIQYTEQRNSIIYYIGWEIESCWKSLVFNFLLWVVGGGQKEIYSRWKVQKLKGFSACGRNRAGGTRSWERNWAKSF